MLRDFTAQQWLTILTVQACTIVFGVTVTSVTVIIPQMKGGLAATQDQMAWVLTLNLVATAVATVGRSGGRRSCGGDVSQGTASVRCGWPCVRGRQIRCHARRWCVVRSGPGDGCGHARGR